jgi:hypothetical protein
LAPEKPKVAGSNDVNRPKEWPNPPKSFSGGAEKVDKQAHF